MRYAMARSFLNLLVTSALALALAPGAAHARFGKSDDHDQNEQKHQAGKGTSSSGSGNDATTSNSGGSHYHEATPVGSDGPRGGGCASDGCCWRHQSSWP